MPKLIQLSDLIIIPTKAGVLDLLAIKDTIELIELEKGIDIFNMIQSNSTITREIKKQLVEYRVSLAKTEMSDLVAFTRSVLVDGVSSDKNAQKQLDNLTKEVLTALI